MPLKTSDQRGYVKPSDRFIPYYFVVFFVALALINIVFVTIAVKSQTGVVTDQPYQKGLDYNAVVAAEAAQVRLGWHVSTRFDQKTGWFDVDVRNKADQVLHDVEVTLHVQRPTQDGHDFVQSLIFNDGRYGGQLSFPLDGVWDVWVSVKHGGDRYQLRRRIEVRS